MRIDEITHEILSYENHFCPYCDGELYDNYDYCQKCGEYVGIIVNNQTYNNDGINYNQNNKKEDNGHEKTCCGICLLLFLLFGLFSIITYNPI